jgi:hypothetical protein
MLRRTDDHPEKPMTRLATTARSPFMFLLSAALLVATADAAAQTDDFEWRGRLAPGQTIEIRGVQGNIVAELASGDVVEVGARKDGRWDDPALVTIEVVPHRDGVTICAVYPTPDRSSRANRCGPDGRYTMNTSNNDVRVDFTVRVPAGVHLSARNVSGNVEANDLRSYVDARSVSGRVHVSTTEAAQARTVSGSVTAALGSLAGSGPLEFKTVSGNVTVDLPADAAARVRMKSVSGGFRTDFPLTAEGRMSHRQIEGTIGGGGRSIVLETVSGSIRLRRGG